jgi:hypothetical protein
MAKTIKKKGPHTEGAEMTNPSEVGKAKRQRSVENADWSELSNSSKKAVEQPQPPIKKKKVVNKGKALSKNGKTTQMTLAAKEKLLKDGILEAKVEFLKNKKEILDKIPETYKESFGRIGFAKWGKASLPVLVVDPFDAPPRPARELWLQMFEKASGL